MNSKNKYSNQYPDADMSIDSLINSEKSLVPKNYPEIVLKKTLQEIIKMRTTYKANKPKRFVSSKWDLKNWRQYINEIVKVKDSRFTRLIIGTIVLYSPEKKVFTVKSNNTFFEVSPKFVKMVKQRIECPYCGNRIKYENKI